jgi:hypothetical protein
MLRGALVLAPQALQIMLKSVSNEGHFTIEAEKVFPPYLASQWSWVKEICNVALAAQALK